MKTWLNINEATPEEVAALPYVAYGSNLSYAGMERRCPRAVPLGTGTVEGTLVFRGVADVVQARRRTTPVGLWEVTAQHVRSLDRYEGFPGLYSRVLVPVKLGGGFGAEVVTGFMYVMNGERLAPPTPGYFSTIRKGYSDFGIRPRALHEALERSMSNVSKSRDEVRRRLMHFHSQVSRDRIGVGMV